MGRGVDAKAMLRPRRLNRARDGCSVGVSRRISSTQWIAEGDIGT